MAKPMLISPISKQGIQLLRVAAYCRVSSSSADQLNSYATQIDYYTKLAKKKKSEWNMVEIFADEGLSGMKANNRPEFQRMIRMCELHQIDLIITKSVSRFSRNTKEALEYARKLKNLGIFQCSKQRRTFSCGACIGRLQFGRWGCNLISNEDCPEN